MTPQTWNWIDGGDRAYLTCRLLEPWSHGFFTQQWWPASIADLTTTLDTDATGYRLKQVHGNTVLTPTQVKAHQGGSQTSPAAGSSAPSSSGTIPSTAVTTTITATEAAPFPNADGLQSDAAGQALWVASADCTPALIGDVATGAVAAVHAGWRGTAQAIVPMALRQMMASGSNPSDLRVALGPAIAGAVYQVSTAVAAQVCQTLFPDGDSAAVDSPTDLSADTIATIVAQAKALPNPPVLDDATPGRVRLDVRRVNQLQMDALGLMPDQVAIAPYCTFQSPDRFFSYRRNRLKKVQWSGIVSQSRP